MHNGLSVICVSIAKPLKYVAFGTAGTPLLHYLGQLNLLSSVRW